MANMSPPPSSYTSLPFTQIRLAHHPPSSPTVTPVVVLTLYRPGRRNAFTDTMMEELESAIGTLDADPRVRAIVLTGDGDVFCAGADLDDGFRRGGERAADHRDGGGRVALALHRCRTPTIAALQGSAVGVGITMTLPATIRLASRSAKIGFVFARRGLVMEACSGYFLPRLLGAGRALHVVTTGAVYRADDRLLDGLFSELCKGPRETVARALGLAEEVARSTSAVSTAVMKDMIWRGPDSAEGMHLLDSRILHDLFQSEDNVEGVKAFLEKRQPNFMGTVGKDAPSCYPWWQPVDIGRRSQSDSSKAKL